MIYNVSFSSNLADRLVLHLLEEYQERPFELANVRVLLPTKRACLTVKNAFMRLNKNESTLLPQLMPLYDMDILATDIPSALSHMERLLLLAKLCHAKSNVATYDQALKMAISLSEFLDMAYQFDLNLNHLEELVPVEQFAAHWQETVEFLDILHTHWPRILHERQKIDPMDRTVRLIRWLAKKIKGGTYGQVVLAGFSDSFPALIELEESIKQNPENLIFVERSFEKDSAQEISDSFVVPQEKVVLEALGKDSWENEHLPQETFNNVQLITAETSSEEALTIALILRRILETPNKTGILVTTDRLLARQVISQMKRWHIELDDSAGTPLVHTELGTFFSLIANLGCDPSGVNYLALLKHPLTTDGKAPSAFRQQVQNQEKLLRQNREKWNMQLNTDVSKWISVFQNNVLTPFRDILLQHIEIAENLAKSSDKTATERLWQNDLGQQTFQFLTDLIDQADMVGQIEPKSYPAILDMFMQQVAIRPRYGTHPRLDILGPIEARFYHADVCVIGGLNEGVFPPLPETGPWLNRSMRQRLGLPSPEQKITELALDFAHNFCTKEVYLTRCTKKDGALSIPSRFVQRLQAVAEINDINLPSYEAHLAELVNTPPSYDKCERPAPCPPINVRPKRLPVTQIEMWRRNPYAIYARYILKLFPLDPLEQTVQNSYFGTLVHKIIEQFLKENPISTSRNALMKIAEQVFEEASLTESEKILLKMKFDAIADFVIEEQKKDIKNIEKSSYEQKLGYTFDVDGNSFELYGIADRIDTLKDNSLRIMDYKTYHPPKKKEVLAGFAPQLILEALLANKTQNMPVSTLAYWYLNNKKDGSEAEVVAESVWEVNDAMEKAEKGLLDMVRTFNLEKTPYEVSPIPSQAPHYDDYAHLARMQEWTVSEEEE